MTENTAPDEQPIDIDPRIIVAAVRAVDAYALAAKDAQDSTRFGRVVESPPPVDVATRAFLASLTASGFTLTPAGA